MEAKQYPKLTIVKNDKIDIHYVLDAPFNPDILIKNLSRAFGIILFMVVYTKKPSTIPEVLIQSIELLIAILLIGITKFIYFGNNREYLEFVTWG